MCGPNFRFVSSRVPVILWEHVGCIQRYRTLLMHVDSTKYFVFRHVLTRASEIIKRLVQNNLENQIVHVSAFPVVTHLVDFLHLLRMRFIDFNTLQ